MAQEKLRLRILQRAGELFLSQGYSDTKMEDIVAKIGISKKNLYSIFANKEEILKAVALYKQEQLARRIRRLKDEKGKELSEKLCRFFRGLFCATRPGYFRVISELKERVPDIWKFISDNRDKTVNREIEKILEKAIASGELRTDLKSDLVIQTVSACSEAAFRSNIDLNSVQKRLEIASELDNIFLYGIIDQRIKENSVG